MTAYYNEIDPYAAQWLRNLIAAGHIARGDVDERSIVDVRPDDLRGYTQAHFFAGIGGWSLALRLAGWPDDRPVWTGSCPCQPFSAAGAGKAADDERHLWPAWFPLIRELRPPIVFGEQVEAAIGWGWLDAVFADLEGEGYACGAAILPACGVGAPHIRQRCWFVGSMADASRFDLATSAVEGRPAVVAAKPSGPEHRGSGAMANAVRGRAGHASRQGMGAQAEADGQDGSLSGERLRAGVEGAVGGVADAERGAAERRRHNVAGAPSGAQDEARERERIWPDARPSGIASGLAIPSGPECRSGRPGCSGEDSGRAHAEPSGSGVVGGLADSRHDERATWTARREHQSQAPIRKGAGSDWEACDWLPCTDGKARPVEPGTFPLAHGIPGRVGRLRAYGNAIVPELAAEFIQAADGGVT